MMNLAVHLTALTAYVRSLCTSFLVLACVLLGNLVFVHLAKPSLKQERKPMSLLSTRRPL